jgi:hypothetical protein
VVVDAFDTVDTLDAVDTVDFVDNVECAEADERGRAGEVEIAARGDIERVVLDTLLRLEREEAREEELASLLVEGEGEEVGNTGFLTFLDEVEGEGDTTRGNDPREADRGGVDTNVDGVGVGVDFASSISISSSSSSSKTTLESGVNFESGLSPAEVGVATFLLPAVPTVLTLRMELALLLSGRFFDKMDTLIEGETELVEWIDTVSLSESFLGLSRSRDGVGVVDVTLEVAERGLDGGCRTSSNGI